MYGEVEQLLGNFTVTYHMLSLCDSKGAYGETTEQGGGGMMRTHFNAVQVKFWHRD